MLPYVAFRPSTQKAPQQLQTSLAFRPRWEEATPNLVPEAQKSGDAVLCSDSRNSAYANEDQCPDISAAIVEDVDVGETEAETIHQ